MVFKYVNQKNQNFHPLWGGGVWGTPIDQNLDFNIKQEREYKMRIYYILTKGLLLRQMQLNINWDRAVNYRLRCNYASISPFQGESLLKRGLR